MNSPADRPVYCVDSDALITSHRYYKDTIFKSFWAKVDDLIDEGRLVTVEDVVAECLNPPELVEWVTARKHRIVRAYTFQVLACLKKIMADLPHFVNPDQTDPHSAD